MMPRTIPLLTSTSGVQPTADPDVRDQAVREAAEIVQAAYREVAHALVCQRVAIRSLSVLAESGMGGVDDEGTALAGAGDGVGDLHGPGTRAHEHSRSKEAGHQSRQSDADRAAADADGGVARQRHGKGRRRGGRYAATRIDG